MLWPFFEGNQRSIKCIAAYIESFPCGKPAGYKLESQRCIKSSSRSKGMFLAQNTALSPWSVYKVATGSPLYKRKGCPLHRELYMGGYIIIIYRVPAVEDFTVFSQVAMIADRPLIKEAVPGKRVGIPATTGWSVDPNGSSTVYALGMCCSISWSRLVDKSKDVEGHLEGLGVLEVCF